jgi:predicted lysophospholipase L1 biosynthesis ABC-type transport system permease subunit
MSDAPHASDLSGALVLLSVISQEVRSLRTEVHQLGLTMATKAELEATKRDLHSRIDELSVQMKAGSIGSAFDRAVTTLTKLAALAAAVVALGGVVIAVVHYFDRMPPAKEGKP